MSKSKITSLRILAIWVCWTTLNIFPHWISKPCTRNHKYHTKANSGAERFAQNLHACKKLQYNVQNCKSGRHNRRHTFRHRNSQYKFTSTNIPYYGLQVKRRKNGKTNSPSPRRRNRMLYVINHRRNTFLQVSTRMKPPFLPFDEPNLSNDYIFMDSEYND